MRVQRAVSCSTLLETSCTMSKVSIAMHFLGIFTVTVCNFAFVIYLVIFL